jgi:hypothetical protein
VTDGERWAREILAELHAARYRPAAWCVFLARSFERAAAERAARPRLHRQARIVGAAGLAPAVALAAAGRRRRAAIAAAWWASVALMLDWHLGMVEGDDGRPLEGLGTPNLLSLARAALVPVLPELPPPGLGLALMGAAASDVLDGRLARGRGEVSRLGPWLDGAADSVLLGVAATSAGARGLIPRGVARLVVARQALPWALGAAWYFTRVAPPPAATRAPARLPGALVWTGLALAGLGRPRGGRLAALGAVGGVGALALRVSRAARSAGAEGVPSVARRGYRS